MKLLKLGTYYPNYLRQFYKNRAGLAIQSYSCQQEALIKDCFGSSDFWTKAFNTLGYETADLIANAEPLQKTWANENSFDFSENNWLFEIVSEQIKKFRPEILLIFDYITFTPAFLKIIRHECPSIRLILGWCGAPYADLSVFREWDVTLSCIPEMVSELRLQGIHSHHINHAFSARVLDEIEVNSLPQIDFSFAGSILKMNRFHIAREKLLISLAEHTNLQIWADFKSPTNKEKRSNAIRVKAFAAVSSARKAGVPEQIIGALPLIKKVARWESQPTLNQYIDKRITDRAHSPVYGIEMFQILRNSRAVFNNHIDISPVSASNMRLFETTGVGSCLITDWKENITELFEPDKEIVTYRTASECIEKVDYLLKHEDERQRIADAGQRRTLRDHTFDDRVAKIDKIINEFLN